MIKKDHFDSKFECKNGSYELRVSYEYDLKDGSFNIIRIDRCTPDTTSFIKDKDEVRDKAIKMIREKLKGFLK